MMAGPAQYENPEPVPSVSQLCALPFVAAVAGYLVDALGCVKSRVTLHRVMNRDGTEYLQQVCSYAGSDLDHTKAGRIFAVSEGIIGKAFSEKAIARTREHKDEKEWWSNYRADRQEVGDTSREHLGVMSFLAVPFLNATADAVVCVLYAEAPGLNVFTEKTQLDAILGMCKGYRRVIDGLATDPLPRLRNYPLPAGKPDGGRVTAFPRLQESLTDLPPPKLLQLMSFNFAPKT